MTAMRVITAIMTKIDLVMYLSRSDCFYFELTEFLIILVSCPVWVTTPYTHSVFFSLEPLSKKLSRVSEIFVYSSKSITPSKR